MLLPPSVPCSYILFLSTFHIANYGGGVYALPALSPGDGYYASFENSLFDGNYASEYAAAIGFVSLAFFLPFAALHPYRVTSW